MEVADEPVPAVGGSAEPRGEGVAQDGRRVGLERALPARVAERLAAQLESELRRDERERAAGQRRQVLVPVAGQGVDGPERLVDRGEEVLEGGGAGGGDGAQDAGQLGPEAVERRRPGAGAGSQTTVCTMSTKAASRSSPSRRPAAS